MITEKKFHDSLKYARVSPIFKKKDPFDIQNWRPVSILPITSKLFERTLEEQLSNHFETIITHTFQLLERVSAVNQFSLL